MFETFEPTVRQANCEWIKVIEHSAFLALQAENAKLSALVKSFEKQDGWVPAEALTASQARVADLEMEHHERDKGEVFHQTEVEEENEALRAEKESYSHEFRVKHDIETKALREANLRETNFAADLRIENDSLKDQLQWSLKNEEQYKGDIKRALGDVAEGKQRAEKLVDAAQDWTDETEAECDFQPAWQALREALAAFNQPSEKL